MMWGALLCTWLPATISQTSVRRCSITSFSSQLTQCIGVDGRHCTWQQDNLTWRWQRSSPTTVPLCHHDCKGHHALFEQRPLAGLSDLGVGHCYIFLARGSSPGPMSEAG